MSLTYTWYGHGTGLVEVDGTRVLVDPFFTGNPAASVAADDVTCDFILVSHGHNDHVADLVPIARRTKAQIISNFEIATWAENQGLTAHGQSIGGGHAFPFGYVKLTQAQHGSAMPDGSYGGQPCGFLLTAGGQKLYLACDTGLFGDMRLIGDEGVTLAVLPIGDNFTMGPDDALRATKLIRARHYIPVHYNTWPLIEQDADAWAKRVQADGDAEVHVLKPGENFSL
jgi:L-ascorbate metabolism protein UlaG (beta-lactamase superfamily)